MKEFWTLQRVVTTGLAGAVVATSAMTVAVVLRFGDLAPYLVAGLLISSIVGGLRWSSRHLRPSSLLRPGFVGPLTVAWLALSMIPAHNFANRSNSDAVSSVALGPLIELTVFLGVGLLSLHVIRLHEPTLDLARPPTVLFLLPIWILASSMWSATGPYAFARGVQMMPVPLLAWATIAVGRSDRRTAARIFEMYLRWFVRVTGVLVVLGVAFGPVFVPASDENLQRFSWVGAHPNGAGLILSAAIVVVLSTPREVLKLPAPALWATATTFLVAMYANHSRISWLCIGVGLLLVFSLKGRITPMILWVGGPLSAFAAVLAFRFAGGEIWDYILRDRDAESLSTGNGRLGLWEIGFAALDDTFDWVAGLGYGAARTVFVAEEAWAKTAHNSVLSLLVGVGLIGVALLLAAVFVTVRDLLTQRAWSRSATGIPIAGLLTVIVLNGAATDILAEPNIGFVVLNLVAARGIVHREPVPRAPVPREGGRSGQMPPTVSGSGSAAAR